MELTTIDSVRVAKAAGGGIVIVDTPIGNTLAHAADCSWVTETAFTTKVIDNRRKNGAYFATRDLREAVAVYGASRCQHCRPR
jgi:hypothetical protein